MQIAFFIILGLIVLFFIFVALKPADFRTTRSIVSSAPASRLFEEVNDLHHWKAWSSWAKIDPNMATIFEGAPAGAGAIYGWKGNNKVGEGRMEITESKPAEIIRLDLQFFKPFKAHNSAEFTFKPAAAGTEVTWTMIGKHNFMAKAMGMFMNFDTLIGKDFEKGLASLKQVAESGSSR